MTNKSLKLLIGFIIIIVLLFAVFLSINLHKSYTITQAYQVPSSFAVSTSYGSSSMVFSNGRSFVNYNYTNGTTKLLSPDSSTPNLTGIDSLTVSSDKKYLLFHLMTANPAGSLYEKLQTLGLDPTLDYWWVYNLANQEFQPLPQKTLLAKLHGDIIDTLIKGGDSEAIIGYDAASLKQVAKNRIVNADNFFPLNNGFLLETIDNRVLFTLNGVVNQTLYSATNILGIINDQTAIATMTNKDGAQELVTLTIPNPSFKVISITLLKQPVWSSTGTILYTGISSNPSFQTYDTLTHAQQTWKFSKKINTVKATFTPVSLFDNSTAVLSNDAGAYDLVGNNLRPITPINSSYVKTITVGNQAITISYSHVQSSFVVDLLTPKTASIQAAVYQQLRQAGYNPYLVPIQFLNISMH